ncbi:hypothetical protein ONS96_005290 [Cadophora gregata f. sp. sojae]|nr:hypothetical protein ONS96_005290 [Cadophora gregata f. sp. sojae]
MATSVTPVKPDKRHKDLEPLTSQILTSETKPIFFWKAEQEYGFLCQWYMSDFKDDTGLGGDNFVFCCAEQYMMAWKAFFFSDELKLMSILKSKSPKGMKAMGKQVLGYSDEQWDFVKVAVVGAANYAKFTSNKELTDMLLSTGDRELVEASPYDGVWGIKCGIEKASNRANWDGQNLLGETLMEVRRLIQAECRPTNS